LKILVTGATGYIGGEMARFLSSASFDVVCMTRRGKRAGNFPVVEGDLMQPATLYPAVRGIDVVCHFAGALGRGLSDREVHDINVTGTQHMIEAAGTSGVQYFLHISSGAVTGPRGKAPADETTRCRPYTIYEQTKYEGERRALCLAEQLGIPLGVARPTFTYGPGDPHKLLMFRYIQKGWFFYIGDGHSTNHPVYIDDLLRGLLLMIETRPVQEVYILGGPRPVTKREWADTIAKALGVRPPWLCFPANLAWAGAVAMEKIGSRFGVEVPLTRSRVLALSKCWGMDIRKAERDLGYRPAVGLEEGVARTVAWYRTQGWL
jgi:nucleoside-diphosphate-sugar epimerase